MRVMLLPAALVAAAVLSSASLAADVPVSEADNGKMVTIAKGDCLVVSLKLNSGTGYDWYLAPDSTPLLSLYGRSVTTPGTADGIGIPGGPAVDAFSLCSVAAGQGQVKFAFKRVWEKQPPDKTFSVTVKVREH